MKKRNSQTAAMPQINVDMTVAQLQTEFRDRDPSIAGLSNKNKEWLLNCLKIGTISNSAAIIVIQQQNLNQEIKSIQPHNPLVVTF